MRDAYLTSNRWLPALAATLLLACHDPAAVSSSRIAAIEVSPATLNLTPGSAGALTAQATDQDGSPLTAVQVHWSTENSSIATVSPQGVVTAVAPGRTQVAASRNGISGVAAVVVHSLPPVLVRVTPAASALQVGGTVVLTAQVLDASGRVLPLTPTWTCDRTTVATVSSNGAVTAVNPGNAVITATAGGVTGTAVISVQPAAVASVAVTPASGSVRVGKQLQLSATLKDASGKELTGRAVTWSSSDLKTAIVLSNGLVSGVSKGSATITATSEGKSGTARVTVQ
jgi:trimeric autotransporter adhesin